MSEIEQKKTDKKIELRDVILGGQDGLVNAFAGFVIGWILGVA